tara:strand:+ start:36249 stop:36455 length:207 start_codon:yes stop_codon:yes gene_type:complete
MMTLDQALETERQERKSCEEFRCQARAARKANDRDAAREFGQAAATAQRQAEKAAMAAAAMMQERIAS